VPVEGIALFGASSGTYHQQEVEWQRVEGLGVVSVQLDLPQTRVHQHPLQMPHELQGPGLAPMDEQQPLS
jgi:hypothetical protein